MITKLYLIYHFLSTTCAQSGGYSGDDSGDYSGDHMWPQRRPHMATGGFSDKIRIKTYRVTVNVQDRYVQTEVAVQVKNKNENETEYYEFGVKLDETEYISSLTMRIGKNNKCNPFYFF